MAKKEIEKVKEAPLPATTKYEGLGQESFDSDDIYLPRIKLAQAMTPEVKDGKAKEGDLLDSVTGEVLCPAGETLDIIPIIHTKEYILWDDRKGDNRGRLASARRVVDNGQVRYKWDRAGETFEVKVDGKTKVKYSLGTYLDESNLNKWGTQIPGNPDSPPAATEHQNYVVWLPKHQMLTVLSLSKTAVSVAKSFNTALARGKLAIFQRMYKLGSRDDSRGEDHFANYSFDPQFTQVPDEVADEMYKHYQRLKDKTIIVDETDEGAEAGNNSAF